MISDHDEKISELRKAAAEALKADSQAEARVNEAKTLLEAIGDDDPDRTVLTTELGLAESARDETTLVAKKVAEEVARAEAARNATAALPVGLLASAQADVDATEETVKCSTELLTELQKYLIGAAGMNPGFPSPFPSLHQYFARHPLELLLGHMICVLLTLI